MGKTWAKPISSKILVQRDPGAQIATTKIPVLQIDPRATIAPTKIVVQRTDPRTTIAPTIALTENINDQVDGSNPQPDGMDGTGSVAGYHCSKDIDRVDYLKQCAGLQQCIVELRWNRNVCPSVRPLQTLGVTVHYECSTVWGKCLLIL